MISPTTMLYKKVDKDNNTLITVIMNPDIGRGTHIEIDTYDTDGYGSGYFMKKEEVQELILALTDSLKEFDK